MIYFIQYPKSTIHRGLKYTVDTNLVNFYLPSNNNLLDKQQQLLLRDSLMQDTIPSTNNVSSRYF
jgi:hypothetical protein